MSGHARLPEHIPDSEWGEIAGTPTDGLWWWRCSVVPEPTLIHIRGGKTLDAETGSRLAIRGGEWARLFAPRSVRR